MHSFTVLTFAAVLFCAVRGNCIVDEIATPENFDADRFTGLWFEYRYQWPGTYPRSYLAADFRRHLTLSDTDPRQIQAAFRGRSTDPTGGTLCVEYSGQLTLDENRSGRLTFNKQSGDEPFLILATDYDNYAVTYGCAHIQEDGTCGSSTVFPEVSVQTREAGVLSQEHEQLIKEVLSDACIDVSKVPRTEHTTECFPEDYE